MHYHSLAITLAFVVCAVGSVTAQDSPETEKSAEINRRFEELAKRYIDLEDRYYQQDRLEGDAEADRFLKDHPMNSMVDEILELEEEGRGTNVGFSCLYHLILKAGSVGVADYPCTIGKRKALVRLAEHYTDYPDLDVAFRYLSVGARIPETHEFLRRSIEASPHKHVRANAICELASQLASEANLPDLLESTLMFMDTSGPNMERREAHLRKILEEAQDIDVQRNRNEAAKLVEQIRSEFPEEQIPPRVPARTPVIIAVERGDIDPLLDRPRGKVVDKLPSILFELNHGPGQLSPEIEGLDALGAPMKLSDFRGKVVVVMFSFKGCGPCEAMYPDNRKLIEELADKEFAFVGVQGDETIDTVRESLDNGTITWRVWWDDQDKSISTRWNVEGWPTIYVLDRDGVIRYRDLRGVELSKAVHHLLEQ